MRFAGNKPRQTIDQADGMVVALGAASVNGSEQLSAGCATRDDSSGDHTGPLMTASVCAISGVTWWDLHMNGEPRLPSP